jgi:mono/diheme cytochrome c family protein
VRPHPALAPLLVALALLLSAPSARSEEDLVARGKYLVTVIDCGGCHTPGALAGHPDRERPLAGSEVGFGGSAPMGEMTGGVVYPANLTSDRETGLGNWTDEDILDALQRGRRPDGSVLVPVMPWPAYANLSDTDARAIVAYLRQLAPVRFEVPARVAPGAEPVAPYLKLVPGR